MGHVPLTFLPEHEHMYCSDIRDYILQSSLVRLDAKRQAAYNIRFVAVRLFIA